MENKMIIETMSTEKFLVACAVGYVLARFLIGWQVSRITSFDKIMFSFGNEETRNYSERAAAAKLFSLVAKFLGILFVVSGVLNVMVYFHIGGR
jgi:hypothetical protein